MLSLVCRTLTVQTARAVKYSCQEAVVGHLLMHEQGEAEAHNVSNHPETVSAVNLLGRVDLTEHVGQGLPHGLVMQHLNESRFIVNGDIFRFV